MTGGGLFFIAWIGAAVGTVTAIILDRLLPPAKGPGW